MASLSKRAQARNEREIHDLVRLPGNSQCADCGAPNPSWASWSIGIFLCMRCASLHRKLGTHISKVKSLSMDTWSNDQVESMKKNGNIAVNKVYNPRNRRPDMPLDADEADSAMERFIRKKYQEKSLVDGKPEPPSRSAASQNVPRSPQPSPPPQLPPKKSKFFGFGLRASSAAFPSSKRDKNHSRNEPRVEGPFRIGSENYTSKRTETSDYELQAKLSQLRDMGFSDNEKNMAYLKKMNGDIESTVAALVKSGSSEPSRSVTPNLSATSRPVTQAPAATSRSSTNPWEQPQSQAQVTSGLSFNDQPSQAPQVPQPSGNPWQRALQGQSSSNPNMGLEQSFQSLQMSQAQPLFPHSTGGYPIQTQMQPETRLQTMTPPIQLNTQQHGYATSPTITAPNSNPFHQAPVSASSTGSNPFYQQTHQQPPFAPKSNPFYTAQSPPSQQMSQQPSANVYNPFGLPPSQSPPQSTAQSGFQPQSTNPFGPTEQFIQGQRQHHHQQQQQQQQQQNPFFSNQQTGPSSAQPASPPSNLPNPHYGQPQSQFHMMPTQTPNFQNSGYQAQNQFNQQQPQALAPQQTGRYNKSDIMSLFNRPQPIFQQQQQQQQQQQSLASIPEPAGEVDFFTSQQSQNISPGPSSNIYGNGNQAGKRSVTAPVFSVGGSVGGSRNPFLSHNTSLQSTPASTSPTLVPQAQMQPQSQPYTLQGHRHASADSVSVNNPNLMAGRHSPDAFASLSARYG